MDIGSPSSSRKPGKDVSAVSAVLTGSSFILVRYINLTDDDDIADETANDGAGDITYNTRKNYELSESRNFGHYGSRFGYQ